MTRSQLAARPARARWPRSTPGPGVVVGAHTIGLHVALAGGVVSLLAGSWLPLVVGGLSAVAIGAARRDREFERRARLRHDAVRDALARIDASVNELLEERDAVKGLGLI